MAYRIPGSTIFLAEGLPLDITDAEIEQYLITIEDHLQIAVDINRNKYHIRQQLNHNSTPTRLPNGTFGTTIYMGPEAATFTYGFYHGTRQRLALRIIPITYKRPYATSSSRQSGYLTSYVSIHPIPDLGIITEDLTTEQGATPLAMARVMDQIPGNRSGTFNNAIHNVQAKLNATFILLHRFCCRMMGGRDFFLQLARIPALYKPTQRRPHSETIIHIKLPRERTLSQGRTTYSTNAAGFAEMRRILGFSTQRQQRSIQIQSDLMELLDPALRDSMHVFPPLLPHKEHGISRPFWTLSNVDPDLSLVQILELINTYDAELTDLALAQGIADPPPPLMNMINIVAIAPAALVPEAPNLHPDRPPPPSTSTYLLLPRAGAIMTDPPPITACLSQAGPFRTSARLEIRTDGYFMEDIRELARSGRGTAAQFTHPRLVTLGEFTSTQARAEAARAQTQLTHREPASIQQTMPMNDNFQPTNAWSH